MSINVSSHLGPVVVCKPNGKDRLWDIPEEKLYWVSDESGATCFRDNHIYAPNRHGYTITVIKDEGYIRRIDDCNNILLERFKTDFKREIEFVSDYYGSANVESYIALYSYYN
jgi:hypothetical protein